MGWDIPTFADVLTARRRISPYLNPTPLYSYPVLTDLVGTEVFVKHENHQPIGAFKVRGGVNLISQLSEDERRRGVVTASTGNHGQSIAYAARLFGVKAVICVPERANPAKLASIRGLGAQLVEHGRDFDDAKAHCQELADSRGYRYIDSGNEPHLIAGVATSSLEIFEQEPSIEVLIVPIGGGSGASGACLVAHTVDPSIRVIGVQSAQAPAAFRSWKERALVEDKSETIAEGLATRAPFELPQTILWELLDDFVLVTDDEIQDAQLRLIDATRNMVEAAGAAATAAALKLKGELAEKRVAVVLSGGNISRAQLQTLLARGG